MRWKSSVIIHFGFWLYLLGGGLVFYHIENHSYHVPSPPKPITVNATFCQHLVYSVGNYVTTNTSIQNGDLPVWLAAVQESCNNLTFLNKTDGYTDADIPWEFSSALFLCMTILTTVGYGNYSPRTSWGRIFCMLYGFIGIPICGIFLASASDYFSNGFLHLYERQEQRFPKDKRLGIFIAALLFFLPGLAVFFFIPSAIFVLIEDWSYLDATYFSFVTLTTIGFGDIVAAQQTNFPLLWLYRICWIIWVTLGIAYWAIIITFITKAFKSKELRQKWAETSHALAAQATELRRVVEHQLSYSGQNRNAFIALKSKAAFDFALQLTGSMGNVRAELERQPLPGIAAAFNPGLGRGIFALMELSVTRLGQYQKPVHQSSTSLSEDQVDNFPQINKNIGPSLINAQSTSMDSGFDDFDYIDGTPNMSLNPSRQLSKTNSRSSLHPTEEQNGNVINEMKWKLLPRSQTQPELRYVNSTARPPLRDLLTEAMLILREAEEKGTNLNQT